MNGYDCDELAVYISHVVLRWCECEA